MSASLPVVEPETLEDSCARAQRLWCTVVHDDPVFHSYFGFSLPVAEARMMQVHTTGRAVVSRGARERMEVDVTAMHGYGLRATIEPLGDDGEGSASDAAGGR